MHLVRGRPDAEFFPLFAAHLSSDIAKQAGLWKELAALVPADVTPLRLLDAIAWGLGGNDLASPPNRAQGSVPH